MRRVRTLVLPDPAPATMSSGDPACITAPRRPGLSPVRSSAARGSAPAAWSRCPDAAVMSSTTIPSGPDTGRFRPRAEPTALADTVDGGPDAACWASGPPSGEPVGQWTKTAPMRLMIVNANVRCAIVADGLFTYVAAVPSAGAAAVNAVRV